MKPIFSLSFLALALMYIAPRLEPAVIEVVDYTISGAVRLGDGSPLAGVPLALSGNQTGMAVSAADGSYSFPNLPEGFDYTVTPSAPASSNPIEGLSVYDLLLIRRAILSIDQLASPCQTLAADVNGTAMSPPGGPLDGVSTFDYVLIQNAMLGNNPGLMPAWELMPADSNYFGALGQPDFIQANNLSADLQGDILAIRAGDVSACGSAIVAVPSFLSLETAGFSGVMAGSNVSVPVTVQDFADVAGLQFSVSWDPAVLSFVSVGNFSAALGLNNSNFGEGNAANGELRFAWFDPSVQGRTLADGEVAFDVTFNVIGGPGSSSVVDVNSDPLPAEVVNQSMEVSGINVQAGTVRVAGPALASISGNIRRANGTPVPGVEVNLGGNSTAQQFTDTNGDYAFPGLANGFNYTITPQWPGLCPSPCIDVYDLYLIQQHILGVTPLPAPYALIAADANNSGGITVQDIIQVRSLILGNIDQFPNNTCWRFVDANYVFPDLSNPFSPPFPEAINFNNLAGDVQADFIGMQTGDVSDCAEVVGASGLILVLEADNVYCPGEQALVQVRVQGFTDVTGLQLTIRWDPAVFEYGIVLNFALPGLTAASFSQPGSSGELTMVWTSSTGVGQTLGDGSLLFNLFLNPIVSASVPATAIFFADDPSLPVALDVNGQPGLADVQNAITAIESPQLAVGPAYCYDGLQFVSFYAEGNVSALDGDNVFQGRGNNGWMVYNLMDNDAIYMQAISPAPPFCSTLYNEQAGACADALVPDCMQPIALAPDSEPGGSLQVQGNTVVWISVQDGDPDIYAYDLATGTLTNISDNTADDQAPYLHGNRIVWRGNESGNYEIWSYNIQTQLKQQVSQNSTDEDHSPAVFGNYVAWRSNQDGDNDIYLYNLISGVETNLSDDNATGAGSPAIFGDWVVWESTDQGPDVDVFLYTISTQTKQNISNSPEDEENLVLQGDMAAWAAFDLNTFAYDLFAYRLSAGTLIPVASDVPFSINSLAAGGDHVVWADNSDGDNEIYAYRLSDGATLQLSDNTDEDNRPAIHAGQVVWEAFEGGEQEVRYYNLENGRTAVLGPDPADDAYPDTYGPFAVWQSGRDGNGQQEVYFFNTQLLPPPEAPLDAGASVISGLCPGDTAALVLEPAGAALEAVWFADEMMADELYADAANLFEPVLSGPDTFYGAWRDPLTGCTAPLTEVVADASPTDNLACLDMFSIVVEDFCQSSIDIGVLEGDLGCLQAADFTITVQDGNPGNGPVIDSAGTYIYTVELAPGATANFSSCFGMLEALDLEPPVLTCPDDVIVQALPGASEVAVNAPIPTWDDNCDVDPLTLMATTPFNPGNPFPIGQTPMGFSIMDVNGNVGECSFTVEVLPPPADLILSVGSATVMEGETFCLPVTVEGILDLVGMQFSITYDAAVVGFTQVTGFGLPGLGPQNFGFVAPGILSFSWDDNDFSGESLPDGTTLFELCFTALAPGATTVEIGGQPTVIEAVNISSDVVPVTANPGAITVTAPLVLDCPPDVGQASDPGLCEAFVDIPVPALPAPGVLVNNFTGSDDASGVYPVGVTEVEYTFFGADDTLRCSFTVEVTDTEAPVAGCPATLQVTGDAVAGGATVTMPGPTVSDNCPMVAWEYAPASGEFFPCGVTTVTCTATDMSGNQSECTFTVAVNCSPDTCCLAFNGVTIVDPLNLTGGLADTGFDFIDADNDGGQDILAYNTLGILAVIRNQPPYDPPNFELMNPIPIGFNAISPSTLDYNQDGFEDFFAIELGSNEVIYYENQGSIGAPSFNPIPTGLALPPEATAIAVGDLGNDGIADLLVHTSGAGVVGVYYEGGCQAPAVPCFTLAGNDYANPFINLPGAPVTSANAFELFDGDCDGDLDIFIADGAALSPNPEVWYFENYGGLAASGSLPDVENVNYLTNPFGLAGWTSNSNAVLLRLADVDNDQLAEAFLDAGSMSYFDNFCPPPAAACCADSLAFADLVAQGFTVAVSDSCGVTVTASQFDSCHWFSTPPDWGDGSGTLQVVEPANGTWMYTYGQSGTYDICVTVFEADTPGGPPCWSARMCTTVAVNCACPDLSLIPTPSSPDSSLVGCCWNLDYSNTGADSVYGIRLTPLDGMELSVHNEGPGFMVSSTINGALIVPTGFGLMPPSAPTLADICLSHVLATPQYVVVQYMDENYLPFCFDTLVFNCPVEETCLYIVSDSLACDTSGYKYVATVTNPSGADFPVKYVKLNITSGPPGLTLLPQAGNVLPDTLYQGDTTMVMWNFPTDEDWFGDTLCFILSAHDGPEERLCCAEIDTCIAFPSCDPCLYKDTEVAISPLPGTGGGGDCLEGDPLEEPWLQELIAGCAERPCGLLVYCCLFQGQPVVNVQDDDTACTDAGGTVYDYMGNQLFFYGGIGGINLDLYDQLEDCTLIFECAQLGDCCYSLLVSNNHPAPGFFTSIHTNILTPGITFSALNFGLGAGWSFDPPLTGQSAYTWSHNSGGVPVMDSYNLFDFCVEGATTTDSISIEVQWLHSDSILCRDTVKVYCPECVVITQEDILCDSSGVYTYTFSGQNWSDYEVNAVGFVEVSPGFEILEGMAPLPSPAPPEGGAFGPLPITIVDSTGMAGDTLCFDIVLRQVVGDSINILCCYARHCIVLPPCNNGEPCPDIFCQAPADITTACSALPVFDPNDPGDLQGLFGTATAGGNCPGATWQELPPVVNLTDCDGGTIVRTFQAFDAAGNPSANPCTQTVTLQGGETNYSIRFPADADVDCAGLDGVEPEIAGGSCDLIGVTFTDQVLGPPPGACLQLSRTWRVVNFCEYDGVSAPVVIGRDEGNCDGQEGESDIWVLVRPGLSYLDQDIDENNALPAAGIRGTSCDGLSNPAGYWVDSGIKPAIASVGAWEYTQLTTLTEDCLPPTGMVCNSSLSAEIQPLAIPADVDGDGDIDDAAVTLSPSDFIITPAVDDCSPPVAYSINLEGQAPDPGQSSISLTCDNLGPVNLEIHAWDAAGNQDFCSLVVTVEDPQGLCGNLAALEAVRLQPNPATDELLVRSRRQGDCRMDILGTDGPVRRSREVRFRGPAERLSLEGLPPGLYLLRLRYADGHTVVRRFVKM